MSLDRILQALDSDVERRLAAIKQEGQAEIARLQTDTQTKIVAVRDKHLAARQADLQAEQVRILNRAKLEALQIVMGAREKLLSSALETAAHQLEIRCRAAARPELLRLLIQEAVDALALNEPFNLHVQNRDLIRVKQVVQEMAIPAVVIGDRAADHSPWSHLGGVVLNTADGRISLVNTLDVRLQRVASRYRSRIAHLLFNDRGKTRP